MSKRSTRRVHTSPPTSPVRTSPVVSLLGSPTLGVSRLVLAEDASQGGSGRRMPRLRDSVGERATSSISPLQPGDDAEGLAKGPGPMPKRKRSKNDSQSNQERHSPRRRPPDWVGASQGCEEDADGDGDADELQMLREQQEMQSLEIGMMLKFQERRDEEEMARSQEQLRLIREEQAMASEQVDVICKVKDGLNPRGARGVQALPAAASPVKTSAHDEEEGEEEGEGEEKKTTRPLSRKNTAKHSFGSSRRKEDTRIEQGSAQTRGDSAAARGWVAAKPPSRGVNRLFKSNAVMDEFHPQPSKK